jgi:hypothetical protein
MGKTPSNSMTAEPSVSSKKAPNEEKVLTETQQINLQADELLKNHKKQQKEYRRRRKIKSHLRFFILPKFLKNCQ